MASLDPTAYAPGPVASATTIEQMTADLKLLADPTRLTVLLLLREKELCVCDLVDLLQTSQPNISQHMRKLKDRGMVKETKRGQWVYYSLTIDSKPYLHHLLRSLPSQRHRVEPCGDNCC